MSNADFFQKTKPIDGKNIVPGFFVCFFYFCLVGFFFFNHCDKYVSEIKQPRFILANVLRYFSPSSSCLLKEKKDTVERHKQNKFILQSKQYKACALKHGITKWADQTIVLCGWKEFYEYI